MKIVPIIKFLEVNKMLKRKVKSSSFIFNCIAIILLLVSACNTTEPEETSLSLSFAAENVMPKLAADDFQLQEVKLLIRDIKIKNQADDNEMQVKTEPLVVNLELNGNVTEFSEGEIPAGAYDRVRFEIHKIEDSETPPDPEFKEGSESSMRYSAIVKGTINGDSFRYRFRKSAVQDIKLEEDLLVNDGEAANLTIMVDPYSWFYEGDVLLNPNDKANENLIENKMQNAFKRAYKDNDHNGIGD
jgi:hypothetical protein